MKCQYILKGLKVFDSELALDSFLLLSGSLIEDLGDIVFSTNGYQAPSLKIFDTIQKDSNAYVDLWKTRRRIWDDDGRSYKFDSPYIGVNRYLNELNKLFDMEGEDLLYPIFYEDNFWKETYKRWGEGNFSQDELEFLPLIDRSFEAGIPIGDLDKITDPSGKTHIKKDYYKKEIQKKWKALCQTGDIVHKVLEELFTLKGDKYRKDLIFTKDDSGNPSYNDEELNLLLADVKQSFINSDIEETRKMALEPGFQHLLEESLKGDKLKSLLENARELSDYLKSKYGEEAIFYPEFKITTKVNGNGNSVNTLMGIIDLLVLDKDGIPHIIDYKTSVHSGKDFSSSKKLGYIYLVGMYGRMLGKYGLNISKSDYLVLPLKLDEFKKIDEDTYDYSSISTMGKGHDMFHDITYTKEVEKIHGNLCSIIDYPYTIEVGADDLLLKVTKLMQKWFPKYGRFQGFTIEEIRDELGEDGFKVNEEGYFVWNPSNSLVTKEIKVKADEPGAEATFLNEIKEELDKVYSMRSNTVEYIIKGFKSILDAAKEGRGWSVENARFPKEYFNGQNASLEWFKLNMQKYCSPAWQVWERDDWNILKEFGIITMYNLTSGQMDFIKVCNSSLSRTHYKDANHTTLGGHLGASDVLFASNPNSMMMEATYGNIELMETMLCLNALKVKDQNACIGLIMVVDPHHGKGVLAASNYELLTCFNELDRLSPIEEGNNFKTEEGFKFADKTQLVRTYLDSILQLGEAEKFRGSLKLYENLGNPDSCKSALDRVINGSVDDKIQALLKVLKFLESDDNKNANELKTLTSKPEEMNTTDRMLYNECMLAIAELKKVHFRQLLKDHSKWVETLSVYKGGLSGNWIDNPGNLSSDTLNLLTKLVTEAYQNVRVDILKPTSKIRELVEKLKEEKGFSKLKEYTIGNQADLYKDLYEQKDGDLYFKNPWDPNSTIETQAGRELLKYVIEETNKKRYPLEKLNTKNGYSKFFRVPLCIGDSSALASKEGLLKAFKDRISCWNPKVAWERARAKAEGIFSDELEKEAYSNEGNELFKMNNIFDRTENNVKLRKEFIEKYPVETNLETLFLKHLFAYITLKRVDEVFPTIKAACIHLTMLGLMANILKDGKFGFANDLEYSEKYVKNKIKNLSLVDPKLRELNEAAGKIRGLASKLVLGFSPVQFFYQTIQGIWNDISLIIRKPDGTEAFTLKNMLNAAKLVYRDLVHFENNPTLIENLNRIYGVNDMDMNTYIDRIKSDLYGMHNFTLFLFKFASRPDYYNRMTIFVAKMLADGSYNAHSVDKAGNISYDWTKDERYKAFADSFKGGSKTSPEYYKARAMYIAAAKLFESENTDNLEEYAEKSGETKFKLNLSKPMPLPRAYTNLEAESMKSLGDTIYGYYSHEKKSMIHSELWGAMFMQFRTFWSGKKNLYLATGKVKLEGKWQPYTEKDENGDDIHFYYQLDEEGNVLFDLPPVKKDDPKCSNTEVMQWKGDWKEGIVLTTFQFAKEYWHNGWGGVKDKWNDPDESVRNAYRSNFKQFGYDVMMWLFIGNLIAACLGDWYEDEKANANKKDFADAIKLTAMNMVIKSINNSFLDFNFVKSIGEPGADWTPFSIDYLTSLVGNVWDTAMGDMNVFDAIAKSNAVFTLARPIFTTLKYNYKES